MSAQLERHRRDSARTRLPLEFLRAVERQGAVFTEDVLWVRIAPQLMAHFTRRRSNNGGHTDCRRPNYVPVRTPFRISTSRFGIGQVAGSNQTPLGLHRIAEKIGDGWPAGAVFRNRRMIGFTWQGLPDAKITTRILWLEGLEPGFNRGAGLDSHERYIYIHGTGDETTIGRPASCGCVHVAANDLIPLFERLPSGTLVWISER